MFDLRPAAGRRIVIENVDHLLGLLMTAWVETPGDAFYSK
jgi:hypothetical protein